MLRSKDAVKLFTSQAITSLAKGDFSPIKKVIENYLTVTNKPIKVSDIFDLTLAQSAKDYKGEYYYKNKIANQILIKKHNTKATMLSEFRVGINKADCVILNGFSTCYEIKTEFDNLNRLPEQLNSYIKLFDFVYVVSAEKHIDKIKEIIPDGVGIIELTQRGALKEKIKASKLITKIDPFLVINSLRSEEYMSIVKTVDGFLPKMSNMAVFDYCLSKFMEISSDDLRKLFRETLKLYRSNNFVFINKLPKSLISSAICYNIDKTKQSQLLDILNKKIIYEGNLCTFQLCEVNSLN